MDTNLYDEFRAGLALLRALASDLTPDGEVLYLAQMERCRALKTRLWEAEALPAQNTAKGIPPLPEGNRRTARTE